MSHVKHSEKSIHPAFAHHAAKAPQPRLRLSAVQKHELLLIGAYDRLCGETGLFTMDGFVSAEQALRAVFGEQRLLDELCTPALGDGPLVHRRPDDLSTAKCSRTGCLDKMGGWKRPDCLYLVCGFLKKSWSRAEHELHEAKRDDSLDAALRRLVYERDGGCCRYCGSGPLPRKAGRPRKDGRAPDPRRKLTFDHVDPQRPATPAGEPEGSNLVVCCESCNKRKAGNRPEEVGMPLRPVPAAEEAAAWRARGFRAFDLVIDFDAASAPVAGKVEVEKSAESTSKSPQEVLFRGLSGGTFAAARDGPQVPRPAAEGLGEVRPPPEKVVEAASSEVSRSGQVSPPAGTFPDDIPQQSDHEGRPRWPT